MENHHFSMGNSTISMAIFHSYVSHYQRVSWKFHQVKFSPSWKAYIQASFKSPWRYVSSSLGFRNSCHQGCPLWLVCWRQSPCWRLLNHPKSSFIMFIAVFIEVHSYVWFLEGTSSIFMHLKMLFPLQVFFTQGHKKGEGTSRYKRRTE